MTFFEGPHKAVRRRQQTKRSSKEGKERLHRPPPPPPKTPQMCSDDTLAYQGRFNSSPQVLPQPYPRTRTPSDISGDFDLPWNGDENPRYKSPPMSTHSSQNGSLLDLSYYTEKRTRQVAKYLQGVSFVSGDSRSSFLPFSADTTEQFTKQLVPQLYRSNAEVTYENASSDSSGLSETPVRIKFKHTIKDIVDDAFHKKIEHGSAIPFNYFIHQKALEARWIVVKAQRLERIATGNASLEHDVHLRPELQDIDVQLRRIYGPANQHSDVYQAYKIHFKLQRLKIIIEMLEEENNLNGKINQTQHLFSPRSDYVKNVRLIRNEMKISLNSLYETNTDLNPYTNHMKMDFFVYPRPFHSITSYVVLPERMEHFIEFNQDTPETCRVEGYNPAVFDISCTYPGKIVGDHPRMDYFKGPKIPRALYNNWSRRLRHFKHHINIYPCGIEVGKFISEFRAKWALFEDENIFYRFSDREGPYHMKDIFYPQVLGPDKRLILFPGLLQHSINTPEEILKRIWKRILFLLERNQSIKLDNLVRTYEEFYGQKLYPLMWGFEGVEELCDYCVKLFPNELYDISVVDTKDVKKLKEGDPAKLCMDEKPGWSYGGGPPQDKDWKELMKNMKVWIGWLDWIELKQPLPDNCVLNIKAKERSYFM